MEVAAMTQVTVMMTRVMTRVMTTVMTVNNIMVHNNHHMTNQDHDYKQSLLQ